MTTTHYTGHVYQPCGRVHDHGYILMLPRRDYARAESIVAAHAKGARFTCTWTRQDCAPQMASRFGHVDLTPRASMAAE